MTGSSAEVRRALPGAGRDNSQDEPPAVTRVTATVAADFNMPAVVSSSFSGRLDRCSDLSDTPVIEQA